MSPMPVVLGLVIWSVLLLGVNVSGQTTIMSSLQATNRMYVCPGEIVTYVCSGVGNEIRLSAPPHIPLNAPALYVRGDTPGAGNLRGPIVLNLISTDSPLMVADLIVQNVLLLEFSVHCTVLSPSDEAVSQHKLSGPPLDVISPMIGSFFSPNEVNMAGVRVNWTHNNGNYDPSHFTILVFESDTNTAIKSIAISAESNSFEAILAVPFSATKPTMEVYARITVTTKCNQTTDGVLTNTVQINKIVDCGFSPTIENGSPGTPTSTTYQGRVTYTCVSGYEVSTGVTTAIATCMANGMWGHLPTCSPVDCGVLTFPPNGAVDTSSGTTFMMTATYSCNTGYNIVEEATRTCGATALWTSEAPTCALLCPDLTIPANGGITYNPTIIPRAEGTTATYTCDTGYQMTGLTVRMCTVTGWSNGEDPVCIAPPNNCKSLQVVTERTRGNTITVRWERPQITGRNDLYYNIFYSEDNQTFTQDNSRPYVKQDALVDYSVSGLRPLTTYTIRVIPENGVSDQEEGGQSKTCEIVARTGDTRSNSPSLVIGFCIVVVWTMPTRSYGKITGYDVRFIPQGSGSDLVVSKGRREFFHAVGDTGLVTTDNVMVQVRAKTSAAEGRWSELVPLGCRNADGFAGPIHE